jgi:hypothetical protein
VLELAITEPSDRPHRPARYADLTAMIDAMSSAPSAAADVAASTAGTVLAVGRGATENADVELAPLVALADTVGIETLASLWRSAEPSSLAGSLWAMYLLRQWCRSAPHEVVQLWGTGEPVASPDAVVAGVGMHADADAMHTFADSVLLGAFRGEFDVALERAAAFFRVIASGRRRAVTEGDRDRAELDAATRNDRAAQALTVAAAKWRKGQLA